MKIKDNIENKNKLQKAKSFLENNKRPFKRGILLFVIIGLFFVGKESSKFVQTKGYSGLWDFVSTISSNYQKGLKADPENVSIEINEKDFKKLEKNRQQALERGLIINDIDGDYVSATLEYQGKKLKIKLRLKGHMTDHLQDNKWSFRIAVKDNDAFMGMKRFSIMHPGTRGYIYEWIYHELMKREEVIALRYTFINVTVNGRDWGIYAVEENFENELVENNKRKKGPIVRFSPDLYWVNRYNEVLKENSVDEYASYYSANPEAYRENKVLQDSTQKQYYLKAIALIEGLRSRRIPVDQAFDIPRLAKFHAIIDLVGGEHSIDWSDIKYYYNPVLAKLEPVAYESFTNLDSRDLTAFYKYVELDSISNYVDWHTMIFSNKVFFSEYVKQIERFIQPGYLDAFFADSNEQLTKNLAIIYKEFPFKKFDPRGYYMRQHIITKFLNPPKAIHAYLAKVDGNSASVQIGAIDALPVEIKSISINGFNSLICINTILPAKQANSYVKYRVVKFTMPAGFNWSGKLSDSVTIKYSILGSSVLMEAKVFPFPHTDNEYISDDLKNKKSTIADYTFLTVNESSKLIYIQPGKQLITKDLIIPAGYSVFANSGVSIDLKNHAKIISYSPFVFEGTEDEPLIIESTDSTSEGIVLINALGSKFKYVTFKNLPKVHDTQWLRTGAITFYESAVEFSNCSFYNSRSECAINLIRSKFSFNECLFHQLENALAIDFSEGTITNCAFENCKNNALDITMGKVKVKSVYFNGIGNKALNIKAGTDLNGNDVKIKNASIALSAEDDSYVALQNVIISDSEIGIVAFENKSNAGYPSVKMGGLLLTNLKKNYLKEKNATITANGINIVEEVDNVKEIIKSGKKAHK